MEEYGDNLYYADPRLGRTDGHCRLVLEAALDGFSFSVSDRQGERLAAGRVRIAFPGSRQRLLEKIVHFFETVAPFSGLRFEQVDLIRLDTCFALVPDVFFDADKCADLLNFSQGKVLGERILSRSVGQAVCVFPAEEQLESYFSSRSDRTEHRHSMEVFLRNAQENAVPGGRSVHLNAVGGYLQVVVLEGTSPVLANVFRFARPSDYMYYLTLAVAQTQTDLSSARFVFYGDPEAYFANREQIARNIGVECSSLAPRLKDVPFSPALDFVAYYDCYNVLNTRLS